MPFDAVVIGEPVSVVGFDYDGNERRGLTARCRRANGDRYDVAAWEIECPGDAPASCYLMAYRKWSGITSRPRQVNRRVIASDRFVEMVVLSVRQKTACCRLLNSECIVTLRSEESIDAVPGEIITAKRSRLSRRVGRDALAAKVESVRLDIAALELIPLKPEQRGTWDPQEHYWGDEGEPIEQWVKPIIAQGLRPEFEMEQVLPGTDHEDLMDDPITESVERKESGDRSGARAVLMTGANRGRAGLRGSVARSEQPRVFDRRHVRAYTAECRPRR